MADRGAAWQRADRCLCLAMVRAAAPHPRGMRLACSLLEELGRTGAPVTDGYYTSNPSSAGEGRHLAGAAQLREPPTPLEEGRVGAVEVAQRAVATHQRGIQLQHHLVRGQG